MATNATVRGRFAPSPSGRMHLGNLFAALLAWLDVRHLGGELLLRMEDLDPDRCRPEYLSQLADDLIWLGLDWDLGWRPGETAYCQSCRTPFYQAAFETLASRGLVYPCYCSRKERLAASAPPRRRRRPNLFRPVPPPLGPRKNRSPRERPFSRLARPGAGRDHFLCG